MGRSVGFARGRWFSARAAPNKKRDSRASADSRRAALRMLMCWAGSERPGLTTSLCGSLYPSNGSNRKGFQSRGRSGPEWLGPITNLSEVLFEQSKAGTEVDCDCARSCGADFEYRIAGARRRDGAFAGAIACCDLFAAAAGGRRIVSDDSTDAAAAMGRACEERAARSDFPAMGLCSANGAKRARKNIGRLSDRAVRGRSRLDRASARDSRREIDDVSRERGPLLTTRCGNYAITVVQMGCCSCCRRRCPSRNRRRTEGRSSRRGSI
jgi:hypothetical protein